MRWVWCVLMVVLVGCGVPTPCDEAPYRAQIAPMVQRWDAAIQIAQHASLVALPAQIANLQAIQRETEQRPVAACAQATHQVLLRSMHERIEGYLLVLDQSPDAAMRMHFIAADTAMAQFRSRITAQPGHE